MDSAKRGPAKVPPKIYFSHHEEISVPDALGREEFFISQEDLQQTEKFEKNFRKAVFMKRFFWTILVIVAAALILYVSYFSWKAYAMSQKISSESGTKQTNLMQYARTIISPIIPSKQPLLRGEENGRVNILLLGAAGEHKPGGNLTDTVMIMSIDTKNKKVALLSLPRDLYVQIPSTQSYTKINSLYPIGIKQGDGVGLVKEAVSKITGINLNYYVVMDFDGFKKVVDDIGGINVISERDIYDTRYPGPNYSYETFSLSKGFHVLDGDTALKYVRERHADPEGDFGRAKRQQQVIQSVKNKVFSMQTLFNVVALNNVMNTLGSSLKTDIAFDNIGSFISLSKEVDMQNINNMVVDAWQKDSLLKVSHVPTESGMMFVLVPRVGNYSEIQDLAHNIFSLDEIKKRQSAIAEENAKIAIINNSGNSSLAEKIRNLLTDKLNIKDVSVLQAAQETNASQTTVADNSNGTKLFTLDELIKKLPATLSASALANNSTKDDIIITLGSDLVDMYKYEEDSMQDLENAEDNQNLMTNFQ
jgi:LCP family protein required for cell wall assembly